MAESKGISAITIQEEQEQTSIQEKSRPRNNKKSKRSGKNTSNRKWRHSGRRNST